MKRMCNYFFKIFIALLMISSVGANDWQLDDFKRLGVSSGDTSLEVYTKILSNFEKNKIKSEKIGSKIKTLRSKMSLTVKDSKNLFDHIYTTLKNNGNLEAILAKRYLDWSLTKEGQISFNVIGVLEGYLLHLEREIVQSSRIETLMKVEMMQGVQDLVKNIKAINELNASIREDISNALAASFTLVSSAKIKRAKKEAVVQVQKKSNGTILLSAFGLMSIMSFGLWMRVRKLSKKNISLENKDWGPYIRKKTLQAQQNSYENLKDVGVVMIEGNGDLSFSNSAFQEIFEEDTYLGIKWDDFFQKNFKRERNLKGIHAIYKYLGDVTSDYVIQLSRPNELGKRICFIIKFDSSLLARLGNDRVANLEKMKVNAIDILDDIISKESSLRGNQYLDFADVDYANDLYVYMPEDHARVIFEKSLKALFSIQSLKNNSRKAVVHLKRRDKCLVLSAELPGIHLDVKDFSKKILGTQTLSSVMKEVEISNRNFEITSVLKNVRVNGEKAVSFELLISDLENVKVEQREYSL